MSKSQKKNRNGKSILILNSNKKDTLREYLQQNANLGKYSTAQSNTENKLKGEGVFISNKNQASSFDKTVSSKNKVKKEERNDTKKREDTARQKEKKDTLATAQEAQKAVDIFMNGLAVVNESNVRVFDYKIYQNDVQKYQKEYEKKLNRSIPNLSPKKVLEMKLRNAESAKIKAHTDAIANQAKIYTPDEKTGAIYRGGGHNNIKVVSVEKALQPINKVVGPVGTVLDSYEAVTYYSQDKPDKGTAKVAGIAGSMKGGATGVAIAGKICPKVAKGQPVKMVVAGGLCFATLWYAGDTVGGEFSEKLLMNLTDLEEDEKKEINKMLTEKYGVGMYDIHIVGAD